MKNKNNIIILLALGLLVALGAVAWSQRLNSQSEQMTTSKPEETSTKETTNTQANTYIDVSPEAAYQLIQEENLLVVDVSPHYDEGHLPGAVHYYLADGSLDEAIPNLDQSASYLVYCHVDSVSIAGAKKLVEAGFSPVYRLEGNYSAWVEADLPIETDEAQEAADDDLIKSALVAKHNWDSEEVEVTVVENTGEYASGGAKFINSEAGGGMWFAAMVEGEWQIVWDGNGTIMCEDLTEYPDFPVDMIPECYDSETGEMLSR